MSPAAALEREIDAELEVGLMDAERRARGAAGGSHSGGDGDRRRFSSRAQHSVDELCVTTISAPLLPKPRLGSRLTPAGQAWSDRLGVVVDRYARPVSAIVRSRVNLALTLNQHQPTHGYEQNES
jgi:hypothetical protein